MAVPELLQGKSEEVGRRAERNTRKLLGKYSQFIDPVIADAIAEDAYHEKVAQYLEKRESGRANDFYSKGPGMTLFVTPEGAEMVAKVCVIKNHVIAEEQVTTIEDNVVSIEFPKGIFAIPDARGAVFAATTTKNGHSRKWFSLPYETVVRIEGKSGELWQNKKFGWDGTPKS